MEFLLESGKLMPKCIQNVSRKPGSSSYLMEGGSRDGWGRGKKLNFGQKLGEKWWNDGK